MFGHILNSAASSNCLSLCGCAWKHWLFQVTATGSKSRSSGMKFPSGGRWMVCISVQCMAQLMPSGICFCYGEFSLQVHRPVENADSQVRGCRTPRAPLLWKGLQDATFLCTVALLLPRSSVLPVLAVRVGSILTSEKSNVHSIHPSIQTSTASSRLQLSFTCGNVFPL